MARAVLDVALEPYVQPHLDMRDQVNVWIVSVAAVEAQRDLRSGAIPMLPITEEASDHGLEGAPDQQAAAVPSHPRSTPADQPA